MSATFESNGPIYLTQAQYDALTTKVPGQEYCIIGDLTASDIPSLDASKITSGTISDSYIESASTWNAKQDAISTEKGITKNGDTIGLTQTFYDYLDNATYKKPTISVFNIQNSSGSNVNGTYELGSTVTVAKISHCETNIDSFNGSLTFKKGSTATKTITPVTSTTAITLDSAIDVTSNTTFYLAGTDTKGNAVSSSKSISFDRYAYIALSTDTTAPTSGTKKTSISTFASSGASVSYTAGQYLYLYTTTSGKTPATYVAGSWAEVSSVESTVSNFTQENGTTYTYYAYRIGPFSASGTATYRV